MRSYLFLVKKNAVFMRLVAFRKRLYTIIILGGCRMRVIITDTAFIWNPDNPALEIFKNVLLVVCLEGKAVTDKYECFVSPYVNGR